MLEVLSVSLPYEHKSEDVVLAISKKLGVRPMDIVDYDLKRRSLDGRKGLKYVMSFRVVVKDEAKVVLGPNIRSVSPEEEYRLPTRKNGCSEKVVVVGAGPSGLFCAMQLAYAGYNPLVVERGKPVEARSRDVAKFFEGGVLDTESNVQFGEGGAGTFSDGKLNTGINDPRIRYVLKTFVECGAKQDILYDALPHVGTDKLVHVVKNMRERIISLGGEFAFETKLTDVKLDMSGRVKKIALTKAGATEWQDVDVLVLAIGHSARDTYRMLDERGVFIEPKAFSVGVRVEHLQKKINDATFHREDVTASYKLSHRLGDGRGVYTFCMCPGGYVVNASSEEGMLAVNGMSQSARDGENANSAVLVSVTPSDFPDGRLGGIALQRELEKRAYILGEGYHAPVQRFEDFARGRMTKGFGEVKPTVRPEPTRADVSRILPDYVRHGIAEGITAFGKKVRGFDSPDAIITGVETRSSSPVRLVRGECGEALLNPGLYPIGEGAGYAGGITSSAVDGLVTAEKIIAKLRG